MGLAADRQHHLFQRAMIPSETELSSLAVWRALLPHFWWIYLILSVKPCDRVTDVTAEQKHVLCAYIPLPGITHWYPCSMALHIQQASQGEKHFSSLLPVCIFLLKYAHLQAQRGEECLALLRWPSGRSTAPFSGNLTRILEQLFQFLIQVLETEDQVTFLSSHQH